LSSEGLASEGKYQEQGEETFKQVAHERTSKAGFQRTTEIFHLCSPLKVAIWVIPEDVNVQLRQIFSSNGLFLIER
jgi:hypothetical protein